MELERIEPHLSKILKPLFDEEAIFYEQLSEILKCCLMGKSLDDIQKLIFSTDQPFNGSSGSSGGEEKRD